MEPSGGVARYYHSDISKNARISTEITGYAVSALVYLHRRTGEVKYLESARRAADFLVDVTWDDRLSTFPFEHSLNGDQPHALAYFFDIGIIVRGLLTLWRATNDERYRQAALGGGRAMARDFAANGSFHPILRLPDKSPLPYTSQWSRQPGCYQLKSAMAWFDLFEATGDESFLDLYLSAASTAMTQEASFLPAATPEKTMDRLHAYSYFLEGLLPIGGREDARDYLRRGIAKVSLYLREIAPVFERSDVSAQLLRVRLYADSLGIVPLNRAEAQDEAARIDSFQCEKGDSRMSGGHYFGRNQSGFLPFVNPVSTAFCMQTAAMWEDYRSGSLRLDRGGLI